MAGLASSLLVPSPRRWQSNLPLSLAVPLAARSETACNRSSMEIVSELVRLDDDAPVDADERVSIWSKLGWVKLSKREDLQGEEKEGLSQC